MTTDLSELITRSKEEIDVYLGEVPHTQFKDDIKLLISKHANKAAIEEAIKKLQEIIN